MRPIFQVFGPSPRSTNIDNGVSAGYSQYSLHRLPAHRPSNPYLIKDISMLQSKSHTVSRRSFLQTTGAMAAAATWTASSYARVIGANDRIRIGFIGVGGMGTGHLGAIVDLKDKDNLEAVAVADVWKTRAEAGAKLVGAPQCVGRLPQGARHQGNRLRDDRHPRTLARPGNPRRDGCGQGGLLRKADDAHDPGSPSG